LLANRVLVDFVVIVTPALLTGAAAGFWLYRRAQRCEGPVPPGNPIALLPALGFVVFVAAAAVAVAWAQGRFGEQGIALLILIMGSMDVDVAIVTVGGLQPDAISPSLAAIALAGTILVNMSVKLGITLAYARSKGTSAALALGASMVVLAAMIALAWTRMSW
jgi:uncharacterized membrane protein (DUF4010 family)